MDTDIQLLKRLFGTDSVETVLRDKEQLKQRARPVKPKVKRIKLTEDECRALCNSIKLEYLEGYENRVFQYTFTDETVDRYGDIIKADGVDLKPYRNNPVVLAFHNGRTFPVGNSLKTWYDEQARDIKGWVLIFDERVDTSGAAQLAYNFVSSGAMKTGSIGFIPKEDGTERPSEEDRKAMGIPRWGLIYTATELLEFSLTPVPANPSATMKSFQMDGHAGLLTKKGVIETWENDLLPEDVVKAFAEMVGIEKLEREAPVPPVEVVAHELKLSDGAETRITTLISKLNILIERLDESTQTQQRFIESLRLLNQFSPNEGGQTEDEELYSEDALEEGFRRAVKG